MVFESSFFNVDLHKEAHLEVVDDVKLLAILATHVVTNKTDLARMTLLSRLGN